MPTTVTSTIKSSGGDYSSLSAWEAAKQANIVTADQIQVAECYSFEDTSQVTIDGWTTDATRYISINTPSAERHDGKWNTSKYRLVVSGSYSGVIVVRESYVRIDGLQVHNTIVEAASGITFPNIDFTTSSDVRISNCIVRGTTDTDGIGTTVGIGSTSNIGGDNLRYWIWNCIIYDFKTSSGSTAGNGIQQGTFNQSSSVENCTVYDCDTGILAGTSGTRNIYNCLVQSCATDYSGTWSAGTNNASEDGTHPGTSGQTGTATFVNAASDDFHLDSADTVAKDNGADRSAGTIAFSTDIDGATRSGSWDIGADEITAGGGAAFSGIIGGGCGTGAYVLGA